jgi:hypothetical protein
MNCSLVNQIVDAVLYEGYILYPYRPSSKKNRQRFTFGRVYPSAYSEAQRGIEPCVIQTECLLRTRTPEATISVSVRFLHPMWREVGSLEEPKSGNGTEAEFRVMPELKLDGELYQTWQEAIEREVPIPALTVGALLPGHLSFPFCFSGSSALEPLLNHKRKFGGMMRRWQELVEGRIEIACESVDAEVFKITVRVLNQTAVGKRDLNDHEAILMRTFASTHTILRVEGGEFLSAMDPPADYQRAAAECRNQGTWPVLVGDEGKRERDTVLSSPIILYDYPKIAPESAGNLFDGTEIDEILTLRIQTMTEEEKSEMRHVDEQARRILERTETLDQDELLRMHGVMRKTATFDEDIFGASTRLEGISVRDVYLRAGDRVRIRPKARADVMDLALAGKTAVIEAVEQDAEAHVHLALVLDDDPGKDLGLLRQPGHRFFYGPDEVEPLREEA